MGKGKPRKKLEPSVAAAKRRAKFARRALKKPDNHDHLIESINNALKKQSQRWLRHLREQKEMSHDIYRELTEFFKLSPEEQSRPAKISEGVRMTGESRALWARFQQERKEQRAKQDMWRPKDWWGEPGKGGIVRAERKGKGKGKGKAKGDGEGEEEEEVEMTEFPGGGADNGEDDMEEDEEDGGVLVDEEPDYMAPEPRTPPQHDDQDSY